MSVLRHLFVSVGLFAFVWIAGIDASGLQPLRMQPLSQLPVEAAAERLYEHARARLPGCYEDLKGPSARLTKAIVAVEFASIGPIEAGLERIAYPLLTQWLDHPPAWSVGPAQIRFETIRRISATEGPPSVGRRPLDGRQLIDACGNIKMARAIVDNLRDTYRRSGAPPGGELSAVIREYNGQTRVHFSGQLYLSLVTAVYVQLTAVGGGSRTEVE